MEKCSCGIIGCDPDSIGHFDRMREISNFSNSGECGIFSDYDEPSNRIICDDDQGY